MLLRCLKTNEIIEFDKIRKRDKDIEFYRDDYLVENINGELYCFKIVTFCRENIPDKENMEDSIDAVWEFISDSLYRDMKVELPI